MPKPNQEAVLKAISDFIALGRNVGLPKVVQPLEQFVAEFQTAKPTLKVLQGPVHTAYGIAMDAIRNRVYDMIKDRPRPGMKAQDQEFGRCCMAMSDAIFPPAYLETEIAGLAGNKESTTIIGDPKDAKTIAKQSLDVVQRFSKAVFKQDIETAYALCANEFRVNISVKEFVNKLNWADSHYGGMAVDLIVERITWIYADAASRKKSNASGDWPKDTPKPNKRALVGTFWLTNKKQNRGRWTFFWVTEETRGYCIAKFKQYLQ
jgi:hypothetical protein